MRQKPITDDNGRKFVKVFTILEKHGRKASRLVPILQAVQEEYRYLPEEVLTYVATALDVSPARVFGVATFYSHFAITPKGKHVVRLCDGTACHVKDSVPILDAIRKRLKLDGNQSQLVAHVCHGSRRLRDESLRWRREFWCLSFDRQRHNLDIRQYWTRIQ